MERYQQIMNFMREIEKMKLIIRISILSDQKTQEDDTQHSRHMAMMLMCLKDEMGLEFDMLKAMKMIMLHDLGEIYVGDSFIAFDKEAKKLKDQREKESLEKVLSLLPDDLSSEFRNLTDEYIKHETIEAKIVKAIDQLQYKIQYLVSGGLYKGKNVDIERSAEKDYEYGRPRVEFNEYLHDMFKKLVAEARQYD
ncbi:hypothetical protein P148_SR1C00001G0053 [candidate division SR1 bacterium RAAC1_SR1_1]|nr:hypothetical protein P148_SR1C00001G0053 [candidate division SR1 bacterium RAAC1_SR1_1]